MAKYSRQFPALLHFFELISNASRKGRAAGTSMTITQVPMCVYIGHKPGMTCDQIALLMNLKYDAAWHRLNLLFKRGYLLRTADSKYYLADKGKAVHDAVMKYLNPHAQELFRFLAEQTRNK